MSDDYRHALGSVRQRFFGSNWNEVYDFIEFSLAYGPKQYAQSFRQSCNFVLERENSGYRLVNDQITSITSKEEIQAD